MGNPKKKYLTLVGILAFGCFLVWVIVGSLSAGLDDNLNNSFYLPIVSRDYIALEWTDVSVPNINAATFEIDPTEPEILYIGSAEYEGGWRSIDGGQSWALMDSGLPTTGTVSHLSIVPRSPTNIYAGVVGSFRHQIYHSVDGGNSWLGLARIHDYRILSLAVNPVTPTTLYAGIGIFDSPNVGGEVYRSTNGGVNWTQILPSFTMANDIVVDPKDPNIVYIGRSSGDGMIKSIDGGDNWQPVNNGLPPNGLTIFQILLHPENTQTIYIVTGGGLFRSFDGGNSWTSFGVGLPVPWANSLAIVPGSPEILYAAPVNGDEYYGIYQSLDSGNTWHQFAPSPVNERPIKLEVQVGATTSLLVLYEWYGNENGHFWKLGPLTP